MSDNCTRKDKRCGRYQAGGRVIPWATVLTMIGLSGDLVAVPVGVGPGRVEVMVALEKPTGLSPRDLPAWQKGIQRVQAKVLACLADVSIEVKTRYRSIPMLHLELDSGALEASRRCPGVLEISANGVNYPMLQESIPLIGGTEMLEESIHDGSGVTVAIIDTGVNYNLDELGGCWDDSDCKVIDGWDFADADSNPMDCEAHGTNVAAIAGGTNGVAPGANIAALKVFPDNGCLEAYDDDVADALDWVVSHREDYNIASVNLSLGFGRYPTACDGVGLAAYAAAISTLSDAGVLVVAAAGNNGEESAISYPACLSDAMAVAASYDDYASGVFCWGAASCATAICVDRNPEEDQILCASNGGEQIDIAAPGAFIEAGGTMQAGTSQAAPHVAGAAVILSQAIPGADVSSLKEALKDSPDIVVDDRSGSALNYPRLNIYESLMRLPDADGDGFIPARDCNDADPNAFPGALEVCNQQDDDCDGVVDNGFDGDADGVASCAGDCDDSNPKVYEGASEVLDGLDNDCDGDVDEGVVDHDEAPESSGCGCSSAPTRPGVMPMWLLFAGLVVVLRRARGHSCERYSQPSQERPPNTSRRPGRLLNIAMVGAVMAWMIGSPAAVRGQDPTSNDVDVDVGAGVEAETTPGPYDQALEEAGQLFDDERYHKSSAALYDLLQQPIPDRIAVEASLLLGESLEIIKQPLSAALQYRNVVRYGPAHREAFARALVHWANIALKTDDAVELVDRLEIVPPEIEPSGEGLEAYLYLRGLAHYQAGELEKALALFTEVAGTETLLGWRATYLSAVLRAQQGKLEAAYHDLVPLTRGSPRGAEGQLSTHEEILVERIKTLASMGLARLQYSQGELKEARKIYAQIEKDSEQAHRATYERAWAEFRLGELKEAAVSLAALRLGNPNLVTGSSFVPQAGQLTALLYMWTGQFDLADGVLHAYLEQISYLRGAARDVTQRFGEPKHAMGLMRLLYDVVPVMRFEEGEPASEPEGANEGLDGEADRDTQSGWLEPDVPESSISPQTLAALRPLVEDIRRDRDFGQLLGRLELCAQEQDALEHQLSRWQETPLWRGLNRSLLKEERRAIYDAGRLVQARLYQYRIDLEELRVISLAYRRQVTLLRLSELTDAPDPQELELPELPPFEFVRPRR